MGDPIATQLNGFASRIADALEHIVMKGETDEEKANNAKYVISIVRKLGGVIFCVWEDILKVNYKMMLVLVSSLFEIDQ